jgi:hypothetical protein
MQWDGTRSVVGIPVSREQHREQAGGLDAKRDPDAVKQNALPNRHFSAVGRPEQDGGLECDRFKLNRFET